MAVAYQDIGADIGPLQHIWIGVDGSAQVRHISDDSYQFYPDDEIPGDFGTFLVIDGELYAPDFASHGATGTSGLGTYTAWYQAGQSLIATTDAGQARVVTVLETAGAAIRVTQIDTYVASQDLWRTILIVQNNTDDELVVVLYRAGDVFLHGSNDGYGAEITQYGSVGVAENANNSPAGNVLWLVPLVADHRYENTAANLWLEIAGQLAFDDTIKTDLSHDAGMGLSWDITLPAKSFAVRTHLTRIVIAAPITVPGVDAWHFRGYCYRGPDGDMSTPLSGVTLRLWVERTTAPIVGRYVKRTTVSDASGFWNFYEDQEFDVYEVEAVDPTGMTATGVSTGDGTIISDTLIRWTSPARGVHADNKFYKQ